MEYEIFEQLNYQSVIKVVEDSIKRIFKSNEARMYIVEENFLISYKKDQPIKHLNSGIAGKFPTTPSRPCGEPRAIPANLERLPTRLFRPENRHRHLLRHHLRTNRRPKEEISTRSGTVLVEFRK